MRAPPAYCRLTVLTPGNHADVALPVDISVADLVPMLMELLGEQGDPARPVPWHLTGPIGGALAPDATLDDLGVVDGELLRLGPAALPPPPPVFDDPVDALAALTAPPAEAGRPGRLGVPVIVPAVAVPIGALLLAGAGPTGYAWAAAALGGAAAVAAIAWTAMLHPARERGGRRSPDRPGTWHSSPPCARYRSRPRPAGPPCPAHRAPRHCWRLRWRPAPRPRSPRSPARTVVPALVGAVVAAVLTAAAAVGRLQFDLAVPVLAAFVAAAALSAGPLLPRLTLRLSGLPRPVVATDAPGLVAADTGPDVLPPAELATRARLARAELAGLSGGCAVVAATAAPLAATGGWAGWTGPALAAAVAAVLVLRARGFADPAIARVHLSAGSAAGAALVGLGAVAAGPAGRLGGALVLLRRRGDHDRDGGCDGHRLARGPPDRGTGRRRPRRGRRPARPRGGGCVRTGARAVSAGTAVVAVLALLAPFPAPPAPPVRCTPPAAMAGPVEPALAERLRLPAVHALATGRGQRVAVIDTGVAPHPRLAGRLVGLDDLLAGGDGLDDCDGHGTAVAGLIGAAPDPRDGSAGVAPGARILALRQFSPTVAGPDGRPAGDLRSLAAALREAVGAGATVVNISGAVCVPVEQAAIEGAPLRSALRAAAVADVVVVAAAGNVDSGGCAADRPDLVSLPGWEDDVLTVGAVGPDDRPARFTVRGPWVDVAAPGTGVRSLSVDGGTGPPLDGTSFAAPLVAGLAALIRERQSRPDRPRGRGPHHRDGPPPGCRARRGGRLRGRRPRRRADRRTRGTRRAGRGATAVLAVPASPETDGAVAAHGARGPAGGHGRGGRRTASPTRLAQLSGTVGAAAAPTVPLVIEPGRPRPRSRADVQHRAGGQEPQRRFRGRRGVRDPERGRRRLVRDPVATPLADTSHTVPAPAGTPGAVARTAPPAPTATASTCAPAPSAPASTTVGSAAGIRPRCTPPAGSAPGSPDQVQQVTGASAGSRSVGATVGQPATSSRWTGGRPATTSGPIPVTAVPGHRGQHVRHQRRDLLQARVEHHVIARSRPGGTARHHVTDPCTYTARPGCARTGHDRSDQRRPLGQGRDQARGRGPGRRGR